MTDSSVQDRLDDVLRTIADAARLANRKSDEVTLIAVSKTHPAEAIVPLIEAGQRAFGENRVQEAAAKWPELKARYTDVRLHLVGQLQSNKAEEAAELFDVIHSVDRSSLIQALARAAGKSGRRADCFLQVNLAEEAQKGGCSVAEIPGLLDEAREAGLPIIGLMCIPPADLEPAPWFALLAEHGRRHHLPALSMGMTADYPTAVMIGATHVRIGTALFGQRSKAA
ncbi:MAG: YggS family pyridoxal phosphate-dependent enzyme [Allosphingosinicella sp.]|uniref:YggS family pyridoxal phosphate-dependent enzyme n=1 Tax=Allosphingosinicella sp. TaxID=2823234 RepID=UPI003924EEE2